MCVSVSQLRCQLELPEEERPAGFTSVLTEKDQRGSFMGFQQGTVLPFPSRALRVSVTLPSSVTCLSVRFDKGVKALFSVKKISCFLEKVG